MIDKYCQDMKEKGYRPASIKSYRYILERYENYIESNFNKEIQHAIETELREYHRYLLTRYSRRTMSSHMYAIKAFYRYCIKKDIVLLDPTESLEIVPRFNRMPDYVLDEEVVKLFLSQPCEYTYDGIRDKAILEIMYSSGLRRKELIDLKVSDIDLKERTVHIREGKGGDGRVIPVGKRAIKAIEKYLKVTRPAYLKRQEEDHLFINTRGEKLTGHIITNLFRNHREKSKLTDKITPHSLRHACALHMLRGGAQIIMIQRILGHKRLETTQLYTKLYPEDLKKAHRKYHPRKVK